MDGMAMENKSYPEEIKAAMNALVAQRLDSLDDEIQRIDHHISILIKRLNPVLSPSRHDESRAESPHEVPVQGEVSARLLESQRKLNEMCVAVIDTVEALEV